MNKRRNKNETSESGFTFVETLTVLAIGALLSAGIGLSALKAMDYARTVSTKQTIAQYKAALQAYYLDCGSFPSSYQGLSALWQKPHLLPIPDNWNGPYVDRSIQQDPWGNPYIYACEGSADYPTSAPSDLAYIIYSFGADGVEGGSGKNEDICSWK